MTDSLLRFRARGAYLNHKEIERLLTEFSEKNLNAASSVEIDLSAYWYLGMHEMLMVLLVMREVARKTAVRKILRLPNQMRVLAFLDRWGFLKDIREHQSDYFLDSIVVGADRRLDDALAEMKQYRQSKEFLSQRLIEARRVTNLSGVLDCVAGLHCPPMMSVLVLQLRRDLDGVKTFVDVITLELLKNVIQHVNAFSRTADDQERIVAPRVGFVAMETFDQTHRDALIAKYRVDPFEQTWPRFLLPFLKQHADGFVELSIADDGAGLIETLNTDFQRRYKRDPKNEAEMIRYACSPGSSRFRAESRDALAAEYNRMLSEISKESLDCYPQTVTDYVERLRKWHNDPSTALTGYGLFLVLQQVEKFGGIMVVRTGHTYYMPAMRGRGIRAHAHKTKSYFPGVQIRVLLPRPAAGKLFPGSLAQELCVADGE